MDELTTGLAELQNLILDLHEGRGPMIDVDITSATYTPGENQRLRIQAGDTATISLPNSVAFTGQINPNDYGFSLSLVAQPALGSTAVADGVSWRQPRDGSRIQIVGTTQALYFYRADINAWTSALSLTLDAETPLNARYTAALAGLVAERMAVFYPGTALTPALIKRMARSNADLLLRMGTACAASRRAVGVQLTQSVCRDAATPHAQ